MFIGRLPNGNYTGNHLEYCNEWRELAKPFEELLDSTLFAYDPDLAFRKNGESGYTFSIPAWAAIKIVERMNRDKPSKDQ